jgi:hypothetical protein
MVLAYLGILSAYLAYVYCCVRAYRAGKNGDRGREIGWVVGGVPLAAAAFFIPTLVAFALIMVAAFAILALVLFALGSSRATGGGVISTAIRRQQFRDDVETALHNADVRAESRAFWANHSHKWL